MLTETATSITNTEVTTEKTVIILQQNGTLPIIEKWVNGLRVGSKSIKADNMAMGLIKMLEPDQLVSLIANDVDSLVDLLRPFIEQSGDSNAINNVFKILLEHLDNETDTVIHSRLLHSLAEKIDLASIDEETVNSLIYSIVARLESIQDDQAFVSLYLSVLKKVNLAKAESKLLASTLAIISSRATEEQDKNTLVNMTLALLSEIDLSTSDNQIVINILSSVLRRISIEPVESLIYELFKVLSQKTPAAWKREVLAPFLSNQKIIKTPLLPKNCILYQENLGGSKYAVIEVEKNRFDVTYHKTSIQNVGHPKMLFAFKVTRDRIDEAIIFAVKDTFIKPESKLYRYPFSNVFSSFRACWPDLRSINIAGLHQLSTLPIVFLSAPSNDHQFDGTNLRDFYTELSGKDFDDTFLKDTNYTFGSFFELNVAHPEILCTEEYQEENDEELEEELEEEIEI
ncbi:hypothetical protein ACFYU8_17865 [Brevibacillus sp. NPDC003359]|uniref:hypothetical protein n=1 Tax=unclassified Brevibacillus TaxID=2684853 RepID=UPI00369AA443